MTRKEVMLKAIEGKISWIQAAQICGVSTRQMRRIKWRYEKYGFDGLQDYRHGRTRRKRIPVGTIQELLRLKRDVYPDFSVRHFYEYATEKHQLKLSYTWTRLVLQDAKLVEKGEGRGKHRRKRERRPMTGMLLHLDGSTHEWIPGLPKADLNWLMDDADGRCLYAEFVPEEGTQSTFKALEHVLHEKGRFCELYHDCGSHFGRVSVAGQGPDEEQNGQVSRALRTLGIKQIFARSPQARGRSERAFGTTQGRLPQELRLEGIKDYQEGNRYLQKVFVPDFNRRFGVQPAQPESAFIPLVGLDLKLILSEQHERVVKNDNTVTFEKITLQIPQSKERLHYVRCPVTVHRFPQGTLGISYQGKLLADYTADGEMLPAPKKKQAA